MFTSRWLFSIIFEASATFIDDALCANCSKPIKQKNKGKPRRFCSDECRRSWWKENAEKGQRNETALYKCICKFCENKYTEYKKSRMKPSEFCKGILKLSDVKSSKFIKSIFAMWICLWLQLKNIEEYPIYNVESIHCMIYLNN